VLNDYERKVAEIGKKKVLRLGTKTKVVGYGGRKKWGGVSYLYFGVGSAKSHCWGVG